MKEQRVLKVETPYGLVEPVVGKLADREIVFMSRHGRNHITPPHLVNYRANIWAIRELGVRQVLATAAVGSLSPNFKLGELVLLDQFLDFGNMFCGRRNSGQRFNRADNDEAKPV